MDYGGFRVLVVAREYEYKFLDHWLCPTPDCSDPRMGPYLRPGLEKCPICGADKPEK
jgi:hypothetical protein